MRIGRTVFMGESVMCVFSCFTCLHGVAWGCPQEKGDGAAPVVGYQLLVERVRKRKTHVDVSRECLRYGIMILS